MAVCITWPLVTDINGLLIGVLNVDLIDTVALRSFDQPIGFWPFDYPFSELQPNKIDAYSFLPFRTLGFPLGDNLWWLCMLTCNGWAAHFMGHSINGKAKEGFLCGIFLLFSESILREGTLHHAPQILLMGLPFFFGCLFSWRRTDKKRYIVGASLSVSFAFLSYWYYGLFLVLAALPFLRLIPWKLLLGIIAVGALSTIPFLFSAMSTPIIEVPRPKVPNNPWFIFPIPADKSAWLSLLLCLGLFRTHTLRPVILWWMGLSVFAMTFSINAPLEETFPFVASLQEHLPFLSRLHWPERWSILLHLGASLAITKLSWKWLLLILIETSILSANFPIPTTQVGSLSCLKQLSIVNAPILMLPWDTSEVNLAALHHRLHKQPVVNPFVLPPNHLPPKEWHEGKKYYGDYILSLEETKEMNIGAVYIDKTPWSALSTGRINTLRYKISKQLGPPLDIGCADVWMMEAKQPTPLPYKKTPLPNTSIYSWDNYWIK